jgi:O-antigen/teichoic acid export membrane protein
MTATSTAQSAPPVQSLDAGLAARTFAILKGAGERERTQRDALAAFSVRVASAGLLYLSQIILARWMGGFEYGIYVFTWSWVLVLGAVANAGFNLATIRLIPEHRAKGELSLLRGLTLGSRMVALGGGAIIALCGALAIWFLGPNLSSHYILPATLALVSIPLYAMTDVQDGIGRGEARMGIALLPPYVLRPTLLLAAMAAAYIAGVGMDATTAAGAAIIATWGAALVQLILVQRHLAATVPAGERAYDFNRWFGTSLPLLVISGSEILLQNIDVFVISHYLSPTDVAIYFAAAKTMALINFVHYAVGSAVANRFASLGARGDDKGLRSFVRDAVNWTFWPSLAGALAILALGLPLLWLFGPQFTTGYPVMAIIVLGFLARATMGPADFLLNMLGHQRTCAAVLGATVVLNLALNVALVPRFGIEGAAAASALSITGAALMYRRAARRRLGIEVAIWHNLPELGRLLRRK